MQSAVFFEEMRLRYAVCPDYPWSNRNYCVFRKVNRKWFCLFMRVKGTCLGIENKGDIEIINIKADPAMIGSLRLNKGVLPAYHMNKEHWLTLRLEEVDQELLWSLVAESYLLTK